jgi:hypothetical protein
MYVYIVPTAPVNKSEPHGLVAVVKMKDEEETGNKHWVILVRL